VADVSPGGKTVGRVNIRVLPDTSKFKDDLDRKLRLIESKVRFTVNVDRAKLDRVKIRADIERQFAGLTDVSVDVDAKAIVTKADVRRIEVRQDLQRQFDEMGLKVKVGVDLFQAERDIENFVDKVNRQQGSININAATAAATAQMRFLSRDRYITLIPELSKTALAKVTTQLLALSGIRVASNWATDITDSIGRIDKNLPTIGILTSSITTLISVLLASVSGILGLGAGLASIVPTLLILPGLIIGTGFAITTLVVAMKVGKRELDALAEPMNELASIIQDTYWDAAREPIVSLITTLMPQLRVSFERTAGAMGRFTGAFADAFKNELSGGRLTPLFDGIAQSFDILATGADAFAGAIVSLSAIAAKYVPRLAQWFVDISITFDEWLKATAEDGRMDAWFERGIKAIKDSGRAVAGMSRQFAALWKAAEAGGSGGLTGFADAMERYADVMESSKFQSTMTAIFRGASDGTKSLADGLSAFGNMLHFLENEVEEFLAGMGEILGVFLEDFSEAFSTDVARRGLSEFTQGLVDGFAGIGDYFGPVADGISDLGRLAGELARQLGPILGGTLEALAGILTPVANFLIDTFLPSVGPTVTDAIGFIGDALGGLFEDIMPAFSRFWDEYLAENLRNVVDFLGPLVVGAFELIGAAISWLIDDVLPLIYDPWMKYIVDPFTKFINGDSTDLTSAFGDIGTELNNFARDVLPGVKKWWDLYIVETLRKFHADIAPLVSEDIGTIGGAWTTLYEEVLPNFKAYWDESIYPIFAGFWEGAGKVFAWVFEAIANNIRFLYEVVLPKLKAYWDTAIQPMIDLFITVFGPLWVVMVDSIVWAWERLVDMIEIHVKPALDKITAWFEDPNNKKYIDIIVAAIGFFVGLLLVIPALVALVVLAIGFVIAGIVLAVSNLIELGGKIGSFIGDVQTNLETIGREIGNFFKNRANNVIDFINEIIKAWNRLPTADIALLGKIALDYGDSSISQNRTSNQIPMAATGATVVSRGNVLVGEQGPEILNLGKGASVIPLDRIGLNSGGSGNTLVYNAAPNMSIDAEEALFTAMRRAKVIGW
jgi:hypothetical protein